MNEQRMKEALESIAHRNVPNTNLWPPIANRLGKKDTSLRTLRSRPSIAILVTLLALLVLTGVAYAVGRLAGFIPGFGFTTGNVYLLDESVEASENGITVRVENAVSDESKFWVEMSVLGYPGGGQNYTLASLVLPSGEKIQFLTSSEVTPNDSETRLHFLFPPLEQPTPQLTLLVDNLGGVTFNLSLRLRPARQNELIPSLPTMSAPLQSQMFGGVTLVLEEVAQTPAETFLQVSLRYDQPNIMLNSWWNVALTDEEGSIYPLLNQTPASMDMGQTRIYKTAPFSGNERLVLRLVGDLSNAEGSLHALLTYPDEYGNEPTFTFDPGQNPQVGQAWQLDETLPAGNFTLHTVEARLVSSTELLFEFEPVEGVTGVMLHSPFASGASGGASMENGNFTAGFTFNDLPNQPFEISLVSVGYLFQGQWEVHWTPQPSSAALPNPFLLTATPTSATDVYTTPTLLSSEPFLREVETFLQEFNTQFQAGPGWIHVLSEGTQRNAPGVVFPPPFYTREEWYEIDADGYVLRVLTTDKDADGNIIQQAATVGNYSINFTYGESGYNAAATYRFTLDSVTGPLDYAYQQGLPVMHEGTIWEGQPCLMITWIDHFPLPQQNPGESQAFIGMKQRIWLNSQTGQELHQETIWIYADDSELVDSTYTFRLVEVINYPPQEVLEILERVVAP